MRSKAICPMPFLRSSMKSPDRNHESIYISNHIYIHKLVMIEAVLGTSCFVNSLHSVPG